MEIMTNYTLQKKNINELRLVVETIHKEIQRGKSKKHYQNISELGDNFKLPVYVQLQSLKKK